jgi:hypothetical protein
MVSLTVRHPDGSTETIPETTSWTRTRKLGGMRRAKITVERSLAEAVSLTKKRDIIELGTVDTLVLVDIETGGSTWTLVCYSYEWLANRYPFLPGGAERNGDDNTLITNLIGGVSEWSAGTIGNFTGPMSFVFNHAHRHDALRRIERNTPGELRFYDEGTIDYVDALGADKSATVELSGAAGTIEDGINITERGREYDGTHVRLIGAHEGEAQYSANLVPDADPYDYEGDSDFSGVVRYTTPRWTEEADTDWDIWKNKDVADQQTIEEEAATLGEELQDTLVEAKTTVVGPDLSVGDYVQVVKPSANLDRTMRVHRIKEVVQGATKKLKVLLSTRTTMRQSDDDQLEGIRQFNTSFQGSSVAINVGPYRDSLDANNNIQIPFYYPDLEYENSAEIQVRGLEYRIDSKGAASGGDHTHDVSVDHPEHSHNVNVSTTSGSEQGSSAGQIINDSTLNPVTIDSNWTTIESRAYLDADPWKVAAHVRVSGPNDTIEGTDYRLYNATQGAFSPVAPIATNAVSGGSGYAELPSSVVNSGDQIEIQLRNETKTVDVDVGIGMSFINPHTHAVESTTTSDASLGTTETMTSDASGTHTHDPEPGIYSVLEVPINVDVLVNGSVVATDIGSGTFETIVDLSNEFDVGAWNTVELRSDNLGDIQATVAIFGYDKIGTQ